MDTKLIIIDGPSTVGKSSISKAVYKMIIKFEDAVWLHEECMDHPIRSNEFRAGDLSDEAGMAANMNAMLKKWKRLVADIRMLNRTYVMEGCLLHQLDRYLLPSVWSFDEIRAYYDSVLQILQPLNPLLVFLFRPDIKKSFQQAFADRGDRWKGLILEKPDSVGYFEHNEYIDDESIYRSLAYEQDQMNAVFETFGCEKMKIDTSEGKWDDYSNLISARLKIPVVENNPVVIDTDRDILCGTYQLENKDDTWTIGWDGDRMQYYSSLFWPYMPMSQIGENVFELISFPVTISFRIDGGDIRFKVTGNYDWPYNDREFIKQY